MYLSAREAARIVFEITKRFPRDERFSLVDQVRRSSRAVMAMIAEAWARRRYKAAFISKLDEALGEAYETQSWLTSALDSGYIADAEFADLDGRCGKIGGMLSRMIDRADDFCKNAPNTDYRSVAAARAQNPITDH
ncbi:MAG: four helix bundle protein [Chthoniobacteraceae bacterium]